MTRFAEPATGLLIGLGGIASGGWSFATAITIAETGGDLDRYLLAGVMLVLFGAVVTVQAFGQLAGVVYGE